MFNLREVFRRRKFHHETRFAWNPFYGKFRAKHKRVPGKLTSSSTSTCSTFTKSAKLITLNFSSKLHFPLQFFITCAKADFLDRKHVVFGRIIDGLLVMRKIENAPTGSNNRPKMPVLISQCGQMWPTSLRRQNHQISPCTQSFLHLLLLNKTTCVRVFS